MIDAGSSGSWAAGGTGQFARQRSEGGGREGWCLVGSDDDSGADRDQCVTVLRLTAELMLGNWFSDQF